MRNQYGGTTADHRYEFCYLLYRAFVLTIPLCFSRFHWICHDCHVVEQNWFRPKDCSCMGNLIPANNSGCVECNRTEDELALRLRNRTPML